MKYFPFSIDAEFDTLHGLSHLAVHVYVVLRRFMNYLTGTVGESTRISYQMLAEATETQIAKGAGWQQVQPTRKELRVALASLERAGLLRRLSDDAPVFLLPRAMTASARPNQTGPEQGQVASAGNPCQLDVCDRTGPAESVEPGTPVNSKQKHSFSVATAAGTPRPVDNSPGEIAAVFLSKLSKRLGYPILHRIDDPLLARWVEADLSFEALEAAVQAALQARARDGSRAPLNPGYIDAFLTAESDTPPAADWRKSWSGIVAKGAELGLTQQPGEPPPTFKQRVYAAAGLVPNGAGA